MMMMMMMTKITKLYANVNGVGRQIHGNGGGDEDV